MNCNNKFIQTVVIYMYYKYIFASKSRNVFSFRPFSAFERDSTKGQIMPIFTRLEVLLIPLEDMTSNYYYTEVRVRIEPRRASSAETATCVKLSFLVRGFFKYNDGRLRQPWHPARIVNLKRTFIIKFISVLKTKQKINKIKQIPPRHSIETTRFSYKKNTE